MTSDTRSPDEIERDIERERAELSGTLDDLQNRFSLEAFARQATDQFREHGGDVGRSVSDAVKSNPVALAVTGIGLAWLMLSDRSSPDRRAQDPYRPHPSERIQGGFSRSSSPSAQPHRHDDSDLPAWARAEHGDTVADRVRDAGGHVKDAAGTLGGKARAAGRSVSDGVSSAQEGASAAAGAVADGVRDTARSAADRAAALQERLADGTEALSDAARARVIAARERAIDAREAAARYGRQGYDRAADLYEDNPLIAGALAFAAGAAVAAALPRSAIEDEYFGGQSDELYHEAERIFAEEKAKLAKVAGAVKDEAGDVIGETRSDIDRTVDAMAEKAKKSGERIADAAKSEAKKQNLGDVKG